MAWTTVADTPAETNLNLNLNGRGAMASARYMDIRVLIIDDQPEARAYTGDMLRDFGCPGVDTVSSGEDALNLLREHPYELVLADYNLGDGKDGQQVLEEVRHSKLIPHTAAFVMLTADTRPEMVMGALEYHPDGYITKPYTKGDLRQRLDRLLEAKEALSGIEGALDNGDLEEALKQCDLLARSQPEHLLRALRHKGSILLDLERFQEARELYETLLSRRPLPWARLGLGRALFGLGEFAGARDAFQALIDENSGYIEGFDWLARTQRELGDNAGAESALRQAIAQSPKAVLRQAELARVAELNASAEVSEKAYRKAVSLGRHSVHKSADNYFGLARMLEERLKEDDSREKRKAGDEAIRIMKEVDRAFEDREVKCRAAGYRARACRALGKISEAEVAEERARTLLAKLDNPPEDLVSLVQDAAADAEREAAFAHCENLNNEGVKLFQAGRVDEAFKLFSEAAVSPQASFAVLLNALQACITLAGKDLAPGNWRKFCEACFRRLEGMDADDSRQERLQKLRSLYEQA